MNMMKNVTKPLFCFAVVLSGVSCSRNDQPSNFVPDTTHTPTSSQAYPSGNTDQGGQGTTETRSATPFPTQSPTGRGHEIETTPSGQTNPNTPGGTYPGQAR
ncbi:MAG: hypothetical protein EOP09_01195 [Proteobacteria bacterium]|nr:MAG: hypothetical protein EOP09_01195 [Pseudomonadota bacterium]